jgi:hypothetical protein
MLEARGFSALEYMEAWEDWNRMGLKDRADVEKITVLNFLSMPKNAVFEMRMGEYASVTDYYNSRISGNGMRIAGWVLFGIGAANLVGGLVLVAMGDPCSGMNTSKQTCWTNYQPVMIASFVLGGTGVIVGLPLALVGGNRVKKWAPEGLLDSAPKRDMEQFRRRFQESFLHIETQETAEDALPSVGLGGSGVYLTPGGLKF